MNTTTDQENPNFGVNDLTAVPDRAFRDYELDDRLVEALEAGGKTHPFPIQALTLPMALQGHDIIGQARTGTGKTLAFGLPLLQGVDTSRAQTQALVVVPTRELCLQVHSDLQVGEVLGVTTQAVYGGVGYDEQTEALTGGVHVVVGTPGRLLDMLNRGILDLSQVTELVLDEADEMLDMGFLPDVERLLQAAGTDVDERHSMLFSATMPASVVKLGRRYMDKPTFMRADTEDHETAPTVDQHFFQVYRMDKPRVLARVLQQPGRGNVYVFCRTKAMVDRLVRELEDLGVSSIAIHGDIRQASREKNMDTFRDGDVSVLVATEVAARGLDVDNVTHVVNYDCPDDEKMYLHRIGRTARAGQRGVAVTLFEHSEAARASMIRKAVDPEDQLQVEEIFSTSDRLTELFDLPDTTPWEHLAKAGGQNRGSGRSDGGNRSGKGGGGRGDGGRKGSGRNDGGRDGGRKDGGRDDTRGSSRGSRDEKPARDERPARTGDERPSRGRDGDGGRRTHQRDETRPEKATAEELGTGGPSRSIDELVAERAAARRERRGARGKSGTSRSSSSASSSSSNDERSSSRSSSRSDRSERSGRDRDDRSSGRDERTSSTSSDGGQPRGGARSRARRQRSGGDSGSSRGRSDDGGGDRAGGRSSGDSGGTRSRSDRSGEGGNRNGGQAGRSGSDDRGGSGRGGNRSSGQSNRGGKGGSRSGGRGGNQSRGNGRGNQSRGNGGGGNSGGARTERIPGVVPTSSGTEARGTGRPRLARRVEVDRLP